MPIEDPSVQWHVADSPWKRVAVIDIPRQDFKQKDRIAFCENLSFSPWHALKAHQPIGELNRIRKQVYEASSQYRHRLNNTAVPRDLEW